MEDDTYMPQVNETGTIWNLPNYSGELFTANPVRTPLLSMIGGLTGGMLSDNFEFPTGQLYDYPEPVQPEISEASSLTAPAPTHIARTQEKNVVQIFHESIDMSYVKQSNAGRVSGISTAGRSADPADDKAWQIATKLKKMARDVEYTFINGKYQLSTGPSVANKTRGVLELCSTANTLDAAGAALSKDLLDEVYRHMADNGALFDNMVMLAPSYQKQAISNIYAGQPGANLPATRNVGGVSFDAILNDFFSFGVLWDWAMPADTIAIVDVVHLAPVFQPVPGRGALFVEPLAKTGASDKEQVFGQIGLDHGPAFLHATITGLATA